MSQSNGIVDPRVAGRGFSLVSIDFSICFCMEKARNKSFYMFFDIWQVEKVVRIERILSKVKEILYNQGYKFRRYILC